MPGVHPYSNRTRTSLLRLRHASIQLIVGRVPLRTPPKAVA
jgi:hypothetical protein